MADRTVEEEITEVPEIPEVLESALLFSLEEAKEKMASGENVIPFTALVVKETLFLENHPGENAEECFLAARKEVAGAKGATCYAFCYDGYVDTDQGEMDCLIAEGGMAGEEEGYAVCYIYETDSEGTVTFKEEPAYIGPAPNYMEALKSAEGYADSEIEQRFVDARNKEPEDEDECGCGCCCND